MAAKNGNGQLEQAMALLIQNQAAFVGDMRESQKQFAEIKAELLQIKQILIAHDQNLKQLTDAIRQKIGFKSK